MQYINSVELKSKIDAIINNLKSNCTPDQFGTEEECLAAAEIEALELVKSIIDKMTQEESTPWFDD